MLGAVAVAATVLLSPCSGLAGPDDKAAVAKRFVATMADDAINSLTDRQLAAEEREARFRRVMTRYFAIERVARWVVGRAAWQRASEAEQQAFVEAFKGLMVETYAHRFADYHGETLKIDQALVHDNGDILVRSRIRRPAAGEPLEVTWRVRGDDDGGYRVIDIIVEGLSMAQKQRSEFESFLRQHDRDLSALIDELRRRIESARARGREQKG